MNQGKKRCYRNVRLPESCGFGAESVCVCTEGAYISYIGKTPEISEGDCEVIDCGHDLMTPAFYNAHCHAAMTLFRGYGEDLPLQRWLEERIFPAEEHLSIERVEAASKLAIAEMIRGGVVSFSDIYMFSDVTARAVLETGIKANLARSLVSFDPNAGIAGDGRFAEAAALVRDYQNGGEGRLIIDMSLHAEYTNTERYIREVADYTVAHGLRMQLHLSETQKEHLECIGRHGKTPAEFFADCGVFDAPTTAAHCVWVSDRDLEILAEKQVFVAHNPVSNLKLGSGMMPYVKMKQAGVSVALGTDGAASNNRLDMLRELQVASLLHKGVERDPTATIATETVRAASRIGALSQGRTDCGEIAPGMRADLVLWDIHAPHNRPMYETAAALCYSMKSSDVRMTVADGEILYRDGEYLTLDLEKVLFEFDRAASYDWSQSRVQP